jgi:hypothetical protein
LVAGAAGISRPVPKALPEWVQTVIGIDLAGASMPARGLSSN